MPLAKWERFVRVPTPFFEALMQTRLSGGQYRVLLWVIRQTYGWHRQYVSFTWYRIARETGMHRPAAYRAGQMLLATGILITREKQLALQPDCEYWVEGLFRHPNISGAQPWLPGMDVADKQRPPLLGSRAIVIGAKQERCPQATLVRRAKDIEDNSKTYIRNNRSNDSHHRAGNTDDAERKHSARTAKADPGKYERLSQD
jgi:phage replication O-like protein O